LAIDLARESLNEIEFLNRRSQVRVLPGPPSFLSNAEQRIARAWRKNKTRSVTVVNLVCEDSIEHQILHLLGRKQALADGVLDGHGDLTALKMPSGRAAMIERMRAMMQAEVRVAPRLLSPEETVAEELRHRHGERALLIEARDGADGRVRILAVLDVDGDALATEAKQHETRAGVGPVVEVVDRPTWLAMRRLAAGGMITLAAGPLVGRPGQCRQRRVAHRHGSARCRGAR
jgi:hypothetical protein